MKKTIAMIGLGLALAAARCPAQTNGNFYPSGFSFANTSNVVATNASGSLAIAHGQGVTLFPTFSTVAGATGSNVTLTVQASPDNTNWTTAGIAACTLANNGTNTVMGCVQLNTTNLANTPWIRIGTWQHVNATNGVAGSVPFVIMDIPR
jgi:hypothetical protein